MPLTRRGIFQFGLLLLCVPAQYYLSVFSKAAITRETKQSSIVNVIREVENIRDSWFSLQAWKDSYMELVVWVVRDLMSLAEGDDESIALEVLQYREKLAEKKHDGLRPKKLTFRVGQVVGNMNEGYRGVVVGWKIDEKVGVPMYTVLMDEGESSNAKEPVEISQEDLYGIEHSMVKNRFLKIYFQTYDGRQYVPLPWLREKYPKD